MADMREAGVTMVLVGFPRRSFCSAKCLCIQSANLVLALLAVTIFWIIVNGDKNALSGQHAGLHADGSVHQQLEHEIAARKQQLQNEICRVRQQQHSQQQHVHVDSSGHVTVKRGQLNNGQARSKSKTKKKESNSDASKGKKKSKRSKQAKLT